MKAEEREFIRDLPDYGEAQDIVEVTDDGETMGYWMSAEVKESEAEASRRKVEALLLN